MKKNKKDRFVFKILQETQEYLACFWCGNDISKERRHTSFCTSRCQRLSQSQELSEKQLKLEI
jgi:RNA polymerase-binding transcription factor DksA